jgi:hypothetical protein
MAKAPKTVAKKTVAKKHGAAPKERVISELGRELRRISDAYLASGGKQLNRRELEREIAERRGLR